MTRVTYSSSRRAGAVIFGASGGVTNHRHLRTLEDPHEVLKLPRSATPAEVRARYLALARDSHPDFAGPGSAAAFRRYTEAYELLRARGAPPPPIAPPSPEFLARAANFAAYRERLRELQPPPPAARPRAPAWRRSALALPVLVLASWWLMEKAREAGKAVER